MFFKFPTSLHGNTLGICWMLVWALIFNTTMSLSKTLTPETGIVMILFIRCSFALIFLSPLMAKNGIHVFKTRRVPLHIIRALLSVAAMLCTYYSYINLPLSVATSVGFSAPLIISVLAIVFLKEHVNWSKGLAIITGYVGVLVIVNPNSDNAFDPNILVALAANFLAACGAIIAKKLSTTESTTTIMLYFQVTAFIVSGLLALIQWKTPPIEDIITLCIMGLTATLSQYCYLTALKNGEATIIAPFEYSRLLFAIPVGIYFFDEALKVHTLLGCGLILIATLMITRIAAKIERKHA